MAKGRKECSLLELLSSQAVASMEEKVLGRAHGETRSNKIKLLQSQNMTTTTVETRKSNMRL